MECKEDFRMLVLTRKLGEKIVIGDDIVITVVDIGNSRMKLAIDAPARHRILRDELEPHAPVPCPERAELETVVRIGEKKRRRSRKQWASAKVVTVGEHAPFLRGDLGVCSNDHSRSVASAGQSPRRSRPAPLTSIRRTASMRRVNQITAPAALAAALLLSNAWSGPARAASPFPDKNLEAAIRDVLKHEPKVELTDEKLQNVYILEASGKDIKDLTGLEKCKNLASLKLDKNKISDIKALKDLTNLELLDLSNNAIKDVAPLANLKGLQFIDLSGNQVEKLDALGGLTALTSLYLGGNAIKDIGPLAALTKLWTLSVPKNQIKDLKVLEKLTKLSTINLSDNQVEDLSPLAKQTEMKLLMIERNKIKDLKPLADASKADAAGPKLFAPYLRLFLAGNPLSDAAKSAQTEALKAAGVRIEG
jgi:internalin A